MDLETYKGHGLHLVFNDEYPNKTVNGRTNSEILDALNTSGDVHYHPCPEAYPVRRFQQGMFNDTKSGRRALFTPVLSVLFLSTCQIWKIQAIPMNIN